MTVAEIDAVAKTFHDGVANKDAASIVALYAEDAKFLPPNGEPCEGHAEIKAWMEQMFEMGASSLDIEPVEIKEGGDLTVEYGRYTLGMKPEGAEAMTEVGKYIVVHERQDDGSSKIAYDIFSSNQEAS
jgi:uncharacterized protein (TIGR02246 family)